MSLCAFILLPASTKVAIGEACTDVADCASNNVKCDQTCNCEDGYNKSTNTAHAGTADECTVKFLLWYTYFSTPALT